MDRRSTEMGAGCVGIYVPVTHSIRQSRTFGQDATFGSGGVSVLTSFAVARLGSVTATYGLVEQGQALTTVVESWWQGGSSPPSALTSCLRARSGHGATSPVSVAHRSGRTGLRSVGVAPRHSPYCVGRA